jgi:Tfp pilus assembly protein PilF
MWIRGITLLALLGSLLGCSVAPKVAALPAGLWQDRAFDHDPALVTATAATVFALDAQLEASLRQPDIAAAPSGRRLAHLMALLFGTDMRAFEYAGGRSSSAAETWRNKRGDCLSLTILGYSLARTLDLPAQMREVRVPASFDRRNGIDFLNNHVNLLIRNDRALRIGHRQLPGGDVLIDFEPQMGSRQPGTNLSDDAILARYYNNLATDHLAAGRDRLAYAHFKAAINADASYTPSYNHLAQLYQRAGLDAAAERMLRHALSLNDDAGLALGSLHRLLLAQGRSGEAKVLEAELHARRAQDPYYWLGLGVERLQQQRPDEAVDALERAQALIRGFDDVHRYLAVAYWRVGKLRLARDQLAILSALDRGDPSIAALSKKFSRPGETPAQ